MTDNLSDGIDMTECMNAFYFFYKTEYFNNSKFLKKNLSDKWVPHQKKKKESDIEIQRPTSYISYKVSKY